MDDKVFDLLEKLYIEFIEFKTEMTEFKTETNQRFDKLDDRVDRIEGRLDKVEGQLDRVESRLDKVEIRLDKLELGQEKLDDKVTEAFEAIENLAQVNERQHKEILSELKGDISAIQLVVKSKNYTKTK